METKKPWAIDLRYFTLVPKGVYFHDVNVDPRMQRSGVGRELIERAKAVAREWPVDAIRLDAYDGPSGGGRFTRSADSQSWDAQSIEACRSSTSSSWSLRSS
jgi:GNAT superfamily N-acetyltransferase